MARVTNYLSGFTGGGPVVASSLGRGQHFKVRSSP
jgi:hypothetical protein